MSVIDVDTHAVIATIPVGDRPTAVGFIGTRVYVTNYLSGTVSVIDIAGTVRGTVPAGTPAGTYWLCFRHTAGATATGVVTFTVN